jgi:WD40-like Beta Propeller Repeat
MRRGLTAVVALALCVGAGSAHATAPGENGKIAFTSTAASSQGDIHTLWPSPDPDQRQETSLTPNPWADMHPAWSPDGTKIAYSSQSSESAPARIWVMNEDGSGKTQLTPGGGTHVDMFPSWSPDGSRIAWIREQGFCREAFVMDSNGSNATSLGDPVNCPQTHMRIEYLDWSPDGAKFSFSDVGRHALWVANADMTDPRVVGGTSTGQARAGRRPSWSPSGDWVLFDVGTFFGPAAIARVTPDNSVQGPLQELGWAGEWSPDGRLIVLNRGTTEDSQLFVREEGIEAPGGTTTSGFAIASMGEDPDWQSVPPFVTPPGYARTRGAGPIDVALVPAHESCDEPNRTHGAPLSFGSCAPPLASSSILTVGTPDANGQGTRSLGRAVLKPLPGDEDTVQDEADIQLHVSASDVRCRAGGVAGCDAPLGDYSGSLREMFDLTITDKLNGGSNAESATVKPFPWFAPVAQIIVPCAPTPDPAIGSTCVLDTTIEALAGNLLPEGKRSTWAIDRIQLWDPGADGSHAIVDDNTLFARQGLFVP